ncbi:MAG: hypothetical protein H0W69_01315 [Gemmatimonadaceae bacterium]|nr:hypothetical protein [Gemmatimonadaceae bacterium]
MIQNYYVDERVVNALNRLPDDIMSPDLPASEKTARELIDSEQVAGDGDLARATAACNAAEKLYAALSRWIGRDGCHALFVRAQTQAADQHPALEVLQLRVREEPYVSCVEESIKGFGDSATAAAIEAMLAATISLLGRLVGDDMASNLIERSIPHDEREKNGSDRRLKV